MKRFVVFFALLSLPLAARAEEGMWTFDDFPSTQVQERYGFQPTAGWLDRVRLSSARLADGCSASFVSQNGLVMTNHHCAHHCVEQLSSAQKDYVASGFYAKTAAEEARCPAMEVNQLLEISDVTARVGQATRNLEGDKFMEAYKAVTATIEKECAQSDEVRCDVVKLYHGGKYSLYKYRRFQDVRLVFAPEFAVAFFGGDPYNFTFPRYDLDVAFLRVYQNEAPAKTEHFFGWSKSGSREGELTFVSGNPGSTSRELTIAELEYERDFAHQFRLFQLSELRGVLAEYQNRGAEAKRVSNATLFYVENSLKARKGMLYSLQDKEFFGQKAAAEASLRKKIALNPRLKKMVGKAFEEIAAVQPLRKSLGRRMSFLEGGMGFNSDLFRIARTLVRAPVELSKPNEKRLPEFTDGSLPQLKAHLFSAAPIYDDFEILKLTFGLTKLVENLGPEDPFVVKVLGKRSPAELAASLIKGSGLKDPKARQALFEGGQKAIEASSDAMIALARLTDRDAREVRKLFEDRVEAVLTLGSERIAKARFALYGTQLYPDATFTPRLSFGQVKGYREDDGRVVSPYTSMAGNFRIDTGREPFALPKSWLEAKPRLKLDTPMNLCTTNDIIGGNSGSPLFNQKAEIVGLIFDGNLQSLGGDYGFDERTNRAVAVDSRAILEALEAIYGAKRLSQELGGTEPLASF